MRASGISSGSEQAGRRHRSSPSADRLSGALTARIPAAILDVRDLTAWPDAQAAICERAAPERQRSGGCVLATMKSGLGLTMALCRDRLSYEICRAHTFSSFSLAQCRMLRTCVVRMSTQQPLMMMMESSCKISLRRAARVMRSWFVGVGMPRAGGERDRVAVRPGAECSRAGYSRAAAGGYEFCSET